MRTIIQAILLLSAAFGFVSRALAEPQACEGRFAIEGGLDLGGDVGVVQSLVASRRISLDGGDPELVVGLGACAATLVTQAPRTDAFVLRSRFADCGARPRFRVRLLFAPDCRSVAGRVRAGGQLVDEFTAQLARFGVPGGPSIPTGPLDPSDPVDTDNPTDPGSDQTVTIGDVPAISVFSPQSARAGDVVSLFGRNLDRDRNGQPWNGDVPFVAVLAAAGSFNRRVTVPVTFRSATELEILIPRRTTDGTIVLAERLPDGRAGDPISETSEALVIIRPDTTPPQDPVSTAPAPTSTNRATVTVQPTDLNAIEPGTYAVSLANQQALAFIDLNRNFFFDLADPSGTLRDVPFMAFPVRTSEFDFTIQPGSGYFAGADAMLWFQLGDLAPGVPGGDVFVTVQLDIDLAAGTARPIAMIAGVAVDSGIVLYTDASGFSESSIQVEAPVVGGPGAIRGHLAAVPLFLQNIFIPSQPGICADPDFFCPDFGPSVEQRLWANGIVIDFDLGLFNDA